MRWLRNILIKKSSKEVEMNLRKEILKNLNWEIA